MNVLFISSEADPLVKVGGLGDVGGSLPVALHALRTENTCYSSLDIRIAIPYYPKIKNQDIPIHPVASFKIDTTKLPILVQVYETSLSGVITYLISGEPIDRTELVYGMDFKSDAEKFVFFSLACLKLPQALNWPIDILHANDWHTAVALHKLKTRKDRPAELKKTKSILSLHNLPFMGTGSEEALKQYKIRPSTNQDLPRWGKTLPLPMGLAAADKIIAVSPTYAREILTPQYGCDLQGFLKTREESLMGILNGIDTRVWDPSTDSEIPSNFNLETIVNKRHNTTALRKEFNLPLKKNLPLLVLISRLDQQKGVDILVEALHLIKDQPWQAILLGTGNKILEQACMDLQTALPDKVRTAIAFDARLSHRMYAGADMLMMPSRYEPCGLSQMIAMRYGCLPVARATGGLVDSITDSPDPAIATGVLFEEATPAACSEAILRTIDTFHDGRMWRRMQQNAMAQDFSWQNSAIQYYATYQALSTSHMRSE